MAKDIWETNFGKFVKAKIKEINYQSLAESFEEFEANRNAKRCDMRIPYDLYKFYQDWAAEKNYGFTTSMIIALRTVKEAIQANKFKI